MLELYKVNLDDTPSRNKILLKITDSDYLVVGYTSFQEVYDFSEEYEPVGTVESYLPVEMYHFEEVTLDELNDLLDDTSLINLVNHMDENDLTIVKQDIVL